MIQVVKKEDIILLSIYHDQIPTNFINYFTGTFWWWLVLQCPNHDQARRETWSNLQFSNDPRWSGSEWWPASWPGMREWEREIK